MAVDVDLEKGGRPIPADGFRLGSGFPTPSGVVITAVRSAPGDGDRDKAVGLIDNDVVYARWPRSRFRVLWVGRAPAGNTVAAAVLTLPSGAEVVWGGVQKTNGSPGVTPAAFFGLLPAGSLERSALTFRLPLPGHPLAIAVAGTRQVRIERGGSSRTVTVTGGLVEPDGDGVTAVSVVGGGPAVPSTDLLRPDDLFGHRVN